MVVTQCKLPQKLWRYLVFVNMFIIMVAYRNAIIKMHVITADKLQELIEEFSNRCSFVLNIITLLRKMHLKFSKFPQVIFNEV